jgi:hypothetical protein
MPNLNDQINSWICAKPASKEEQEKVRAARRNTAPLPAFLPGDYCIIIREADGYILSVDDPDQSSYRLGDDMEKITQALKRFRLDDRLLNAIDIAREFGASQFVFQSGTVIPLKLDVQTPKLDFREFDDPDQAGRLVDLPPMSAPF